MTAGARYNRDMNLNAIQWLGCLYAGLILFGCFVFVHVLKLARIGYRAKKSLPPERPKPEPKTEEPVYYIVEKKKKRAKASYSEPKRISFHEEKQ